MPFWYHVPLPTLAPECGLVRLVQWLVEDGEQVSPGTRLVVVETTPTDRFVILANGEGFLREKLFPAGAELPPGTAIAVLDVDGEKIPYGKPYSTAERLDPLTL